MKKNANRFISIFLHKTVSQWITNLDINPVTLKLIDEKVESRFGCIGTGDYFLNIASVHRH